MDVITFVLPAHWASALINDDFSGLDDEEDAAVRHWLDTEPDIGGGCLDCTDEPEFRHYNDAGTLPCECLTYTFPYAPDANTLPNMLAGTAPNLPHRS